MFFALCMTLSTYYHNSQVEEWVEVNGQVTFYDSHKQTYKVKYTYVVDGKRYENNKLNVTGLGISNKEYNHWIDCEHFKTIIPVYYAKGYPESSNLRKEITDDEIRKLRNLILQVVIFLGIACFLQNKGWHRPSIPPPEWLNKKR